MLAIRMQRTGRKGFATYRVIVQDVRQTPTSGRVIALLGHYNPHTKEAQINSEKSKFYLSNGAHPSARVALMFKKQGIKLPEWVELPAKKKSSIKNVEKLRENRPAGPAAKEAPAVEVTPAEEPAAAATDPSAEETIAQTAAAETAEPEVTPAETEQTEEPAK